MSKVEEIIWYIFWYYVGTKEGWTSALTWKESSYELFLKYK